MFNYLDKSLLDLPDAGDRHCSVGVVLYPGNDRLKSPVAAAPASVISSIEQIVIILVSSNHWE